MTVRYDNPAGLTAGSVILELIASFCQGLRFYSRSRADPEIITSDWPILAAFVFGARMTVLEIYGKLGI